LHLGVWRVSVTMEPPGSMDETGAGRLELRGGGDGVLPGVVGCAMIKACAEFG